MTPVVACWRRVGPPGYDPSYPNDDVCVLEEREDGWVLNGTATYHVDGVQALLMYHLECDTAWRTRHGHVGGWLGNRRPEIDIVRTDSGTWTLDGAAVPHLEDCVDLDFGFTPATNLPTLRRLALAPGQAADVSVAWLDVATGTLEPLPQRYERRAASSYWYESRKHSYAALLEVTPDGFTRDYPGLWVMES